MSIDEAETQVFQRDSELEELVAGSNGQVEAGTPQPVLDALRERRAQLAAERFYDVEVPGYGGLLVLRMTPISASLWTKLADRVTKTNAPDRNFNLNADTMIATVKQVLGRARTTDPLVVLEDEHGEPLRLDDRLAEALGLEGVKKARDVVRAVFGMANSPELTVNTTVSDYVDWCREANADVEDDLLGEP